MTIREEIFKAEDLPRELVPTPEWPAVDGQVYARGLSGDERDKWEVFLAHNIDRKAMAEDEGIALAKIGTMHIRSMIVALGACDAEGDPIFQDADLVQLGGKSAAALARIRDAIYRLSGMSDDKEETAKNLPEAPGSDSSTDSPSNSDTSASEECSAKSIAESCPGGNDTMP